MTRKPPEIPFPLLRLIAGCILKLGFAFEVRGRHYLEQCQGPVILAGNHTGYLDSLALLAGCKHPFRFLMAEVVFTWGWVGKLVRYGNIIPIYRGQERRMMVTALKTLKQNGRICIFPEGKLSRDGQLNSLQPGVIFLQEKSGAPIIPFAIHGGFEAWPHEQKFPVFKKVVLEFGEPMTVQPNHDRDTVLHYLTQKILHLKKENIPKNISNQTIYTLQ